MKNKLIIFITLAFAQVFFYTGYAQSPYISGSSTACGYTTSTFRIINLPSGITDGDVVWSCSDNLYPQSGNTGLTKVFNISTNGESWAQAYITPLNLLLDKFIFIANWPTMEIHETEYTSCGTPVFIEVSQGLATRDFKWAIANPYVNADLSNEYGFDTEVTFYENGTWALLGFDITSCGEAPAPTHLYWIDVSGCRSSTPAVVVAYPNPVSNILTIEIDEEAIKEFEQNNAAVAANLKATASDYDVRLYNLQANLLLQQKTYRNTIEFNVANLPNGIYFLHVYYEKGNKPIIQQIIVQH